MAGVDYGDSQILQITTQEKEGELVRFKTTLPVSGREVSSEWMRPDATMSGSTLISWCNNIRQQIDADVREAEAYRKRKKDLDAAEAEDLGMKKVAVEEVTNPVEYSTHQRDMYRDRVQILEERIDNCKSERTRMREHLEQWEKIVNSLTGEVDE